MKSLQSIGRGALAFAFALALCAAAPAQTSNPSASSAGVTDVATDATLTGGPCTTTCTIGINGPVSAAKGGSGVASPTVHTVQIGEGASPFNGAGPGSLGQFLGSNGASADPTMVSGPKKLLNTLTASNSASLTDTTSFGLGYNEYDIVFEKVIPASSGASCEIQVQTGGSTIQTSSYISGTLFGNGSSAGSASATTFIPCSVVSNLPTTAPGLSVTFHVSIPSDTTGPKIFYSYGVHLDSTTPYIFQAGGWWNGSSVAITGFQVCMSSSTPTCNVNTTSGVIKVYGYL